MIGLSSKFKYNYVKLNQIDDNAIRDISDKLYHGIFSKIWTGLSQQNFLEFFFQGDFSQNDLCIITKAEKIIGYTHLRTVEMRIDQKKYKVVRVTANLLPQFMGHHLVTIPIFKSGLIAFIKATLCNKRFLFFFTTNTPSSYCAFHNRTLYTYPSPNRKTPKQFYKIIPKLKDYFHLQKGRSLFSCKFEGVNLTREATQSLKVKENRITKYYTQMCPDYESGEALITILPLNLVTGTLEILHQVYVKFYERLIRPYRKKSDHHLEEAKA